MAFRRAEWMARAKAAGGGVEGGGGEEDLAPLGESDLEEDCLDGEGGVGREGGGALDSPDASMQGVRWIRRWERGRDINGPPLVMAERREEVMEGSNATRGL